MALDEREMLNRLRDAIIALKEMRAQRDALLVAKSEPIAIIGMGCRFPRDANTPDSFFQSLLDGFDAIAPIPADRWSVDPNVDTNPQLQGTRWGAFVDDVAQFDPAFFGISPREAERMDPQQRILLEVAWEALERSGLTPESLSGTKTGVFVGILNTDYFLLNLELPTEQQDVYSATGNGHCFPAGRLAYTFGFQGPAVTVDTACSSSLVATHLACQSLRTGDSDMALVGGVSLMLHPQTTELIAKTGALAPDGRCKSFDARANGFVRGEGCGVVVLKRLSDAQRDRDPIIAVIRGSAVNQDGRSTGLTTPNVLAQQAMLEQALVNAQLSSAEIGYIEAHGTGTPLGDPIEMEALLSVFGKPRTDSSRCWVGSIKTNIGHLEAAAGIAGLMKAALALQHEKIPPNLHLRTLNPRISLTGTPLAIPTEVVPWPRISNSRHAGISSFGMSGTNAHVILEDAPAIATKPQEKERSAYLLPLSAKTPEALSAIVTAYAEWFATTTDVSMDDIVYTASMRRAHHEYRIAAVARTREELSKSLHSFAPDEQPPGIVQGRAKSHGRPQIVFVFPGQGSQWIGMGRELLSEEPAFREAIEACDRAIQKEAGFSILEQINAEESQSRIGEIDVLQPLLFAIEVALAALWQSWGIIPDCVVGHSMGEVAAAHVAGMLGLEHAVKVICQRSRLMRRIRGHGAMGLVGLSMNEVESAIAGRDNDLNIAASNGPQTTVLSGDQKALEEVLGILEARGVFCRRIKVDVASHSPQVDVLHDELLEALRQVHSTPGKCRMMSTVTGKLLDGVDLAAEYWWDNLRKPVLFFQTTQELLREKQSIFVELSPHPVLLTALQETLRSSPNTGIALESMRRQVSQRRVMLEALGTLWTNGVPFDWTKIHADGRVVALPTYRWQRERYWIEAAAAPAKAEKRTEKRTESIDDWLFRLEWQYAPLEKAPNKSHAAHDAWLVLCDSGRIGVNIVASLRGRGATCIRVDVGHSFIQHSPHHYSINFADPADYAHVLRKAFGTGLVCRGVIHLVSLDASGWDETTSDTLHAYQQRPLLSALYLAQSLVRASFATTPKLWLVSRGAITTGGTDTIASVAQASLWGFGRTIMREHPELGCTCIDLDISAKFDTVTTFIRQLEAGDHEEHVALRPNGRYVARYRRTRLDAAASVDFAIKSDASYLITGGLGGLGLSVAQWMVDKGARHVALMGRRKPSEHANEGIRRMKAVGANVLVIQGDVARPDDVLSALCMLDATMPELRGIVHAAGALEDRTLLELSAENVRHVFAPKVDGAWNLHTFSLNLPLDFFVMYSSGAGLFGSPGQANYAAANAFVDALAQARFARGLPAISIQWGAFSEVGLAAQQENRGARINSRGLANLSPTDGLRALEQLLQRPRAHVSVMRLNVSQWFEFSPELTRATLWADLATEAAPKSPNEKVPRTSSTPAIIEPNWRQQLLSASPAIRSSMLTEHVRAQFSKVLRMDSAKIGFDEEIQHYGMDSLMAIEVRNRLQASLDIQFSVTEIWAHGSVAKLAAWLSAKLGNEQKLDITGTQTEQSLKGAPASPTVVGARGEWIVVPRPSPNAKMRLFCFPYAGGSASAFVSWAAHLPPEIELCAMQPPGRQARIAEPIPQNIEEIVSSIIPSLLPYLDRPFAMFGHCLGAIIMFEVVRRIGSEHWLHPIHLFASGAPPPRRYLVPGFGARTDEDFLNLLRAIGLAQPEVLADPDIVRSMLPMVRADFDIAARYRFEGSARIDTPITTFSADSDVFAPPNIVEQWRLETTSHFNKHSFSGGHYFLVPERESILRIIEMEMIIRQAAVQQQTVPSDPIRWIVRNEPDVEPLLRVVCFPGIGGIANDFHALSTTLPPGVELCAIELPGHGTRKDEAPLGRVDDLVSILSAALQPILGVPTVFVGHDLGALVMYEIAVRQHRGGKDKPKALVIIGAMAPEVHYFAPMHHLPTDAFKETLRLLDLSFDEHSITTQSIRIDCAALTSYEMTARVILDAPMMAIAGTNDALIAARSLEGWQQHTSLPLKIHRLPIRHMELRLDAQVFSIISAELHRLLKSFRA